MNSSAHFGSGQMPPRRTSCLSRNGSRAWNSVLIGTDDISDRRCHRLSTTNWIARSPMSLWPVAPGLFPGVGFVSGAGVYSDKDKISALFNPRAWRSILILNLNLENLVEGLVTSCGLCVSSTHRLNASGIAASALNDLRPAQVPKHNLSAGIRCAGGGGPMVQVRRCLRAISEASLKMI